MRKKQNRVRLLNYSLITIYYTLLLSCRTSPVLPPPDITANIPLEAGGTAYILVDTKTAGPVLEHITVTGLDKKTFNQMIDRTNYAVAAVYPQGSGRRFQLAAWGNYPASGAKTVLGLSREWKKFRSPVTKTNYWHSSGTGLSVAVNRGQALVAASENNTVIDPYVAGGVKAPDGFGEFTAGSVFSCWFEQAGPLINQKLHEMGIPPEINLPAERLFFCLFPAARPAAGNVYEARLRIQAPGSIQAGMIESFFTIARNSFSPGAETDGAEGGATAGPAALAAILFANTPVRSGNNLDIRTEPLSEGELSLLLGLFSLQ